MISALPGVLDLAAAGALDLAAASDIVTDMMSLFGMSADEAGRASDVFAAAQASSNTNVEQLAEALKYSGASAAAAGMELEQTSAILGVFADNGLKGSGAGTTLDAMFRDLKKSVSDGVVEIGDATVAVYDADGAMRSMADIMSDVEKATDGMSDAQRDAALSNVFQSQALRGVNILMGEGTDAIYDLESALYGSEGAASDMAKVMNDNLGGAFKEMKSALEGAAISMYELMEPAIRNIIEWITNLIRWFTDLDDSTKTIIMVVAGLAAAIGPLLIAFGAIVKVAGTVMVGLKAVGAVLAFLVSPVGLIIAAIVGLIAIFVHLWRTNEDFRDNVIAIWSKVREFISTALTAIANFAQSILGKIYAFWDENGQMILSAVTNVFNAIKAVFDFVLPYALMLVCQIWSNIKGVISGALDVILGVVKLFASIFTGDWSGALEAVKQIVSGALTAIWNLIQLTLMGRVMGIARSFLGLFRGSFSTGLNAVRSLFSNIFGNIVKFVKGLGSTFKNAGKGLIDNMIKGITGMASKAVDSVKNIASSIRNLLPFSPAREGPLSDLDKLDFAGPITGSIVDGLPKIKSEMSHALEVPSTDVKPMSTASSAANSSNGGGRPIVLEIDGRQMALGFMPHLEREIRLATGVKMS